MFPLLSSLHILLMARVFNEVFSSLSLADEHLAKNISICHLVRGYDKGP